MIPSTNSKLYVTEDWKKIYQSFRNADFQSYDFETLRRTMIQYLQENYPEDFNDFIDSSEYIALIDLIAYLGQNLSFRIDLNARENFIETAQRRDSILRLAQLISYVPSRNVPSNGFLKLTSVATTDSIIDSNGINLANVTVGWNDNTNSNWYGQFITILNSAMSGSFVFGKPYDRKTIGGILTEQYRINSSNRDIPVYSFLKSINGTSMNFEIVPCTFSDKTFIYEEAPRPGSTFSFVYRNDNQGAGSVNTGFFAHFRQGELAVSTFTIDNPVSNEIVGINSNNINNTDVWLWQLDGDGNYSNLWTKVPDIIGNNIIYNSLSKDQRKIYSVRTRDQDQVDLNFADGSFGDLPKGTFRVFYRQSNGLTYSVRPEQMSGITVEMPYFNKSGQSHTLTLTFALQYSVNNATAAESNASIQQKAPQAFYVQNRMITAEDYNIAPLTLGSDIVKVKSTNRVSSGVSKYFELSDVSGKYSKTNIFAADGILYKETKSNFFTFGLGSRNEILAVIKNQLAPLVKSPSIRSFYYDEYSRPDLLSLSLEWKTPVSTQAKGYFDNSGTPVPVGSTVAGNAKYISPGALVKFVPPSGKYFTPAGKHTNTASSTTSEYLWVKVISIVGDGSNGGQGELEDGSGPIVLSQFVQEDSIPVEVLPKFVDTYSAAFENDLVNLCLNRQKFGLSFSSVNRSWNIIFEPNLDTTGPFSLANQGDTSGTNLDASWIFYFSLIGNTYKVTYRLTDYIFESEEETSFFTDQNNINYDFVNNSVIKDQISVLSVNPMVSSAQALGTDYIWQVDGPVVEVDGYIDAKKVKVSFYDRNNTGEIIDPDSFTKIIGTSSNTSYVFFEKIEGDAVYGDYNSLIPASNFITTSTTSSVTTPLLDQLYYFTSTNVVNTYTGSVWVYRPEYTRYEGRSDLKFHYLHNSSDNRRIDPSKSNIIDIYLLTGSYDNEYRTWLITGLGSEPLPPTSQSLEQSYSSILEPIKAISDEIVYQPVKYKVLFGSKAVENLRATFKAVRNPNRTVSDNDIKSRILVAIQDFFSIENWDFGQTFYFSELVTYVMNIMTPDITNFVIVPNSNNDFGSLYEIKCASNEIFINGATANDIEVIDAITASQLNATSIINSTGS